MLKEQLENQTYRMNPYNEFKVYEPKERVIKSCSFKDKVVQHCLCDNILLPRLKYEFMEDVESPINDTPIITEELYRAVQNKKAITLVDKVCVTNFL